MNIEGNCDLCGHFLKWERINTDFCDECTGLLSAEQHEAEIGIGNGQICHIDDDCCRHCIQKWPMIETVYNAVYGVTK
jgi:hypothetical protein